MLFFIATNDRYSFEHLIKINEAISHIDEVYPYVQYLFY